MTIPAVSAIESLHSSTTYGVKAVETEFASQISISLQQDPYCPPPALTSLSAGFHPTELALRCMLVRGRGIFEEYEFEFRSTYLSIDELDVLWALGVAITSSTEEGSRVSDAPSQKLLETMASKMPATSGTENTYYLAPALFVENFDIPPSSSISEKYSAPFNPQGKLDTSTSNVNSLFKSLSIWYLV